MISIERIQRVSSGLYEEDFASGYLYGSSTKIVLNLRNKHMGCLCALRVHDRKFGCLSGPVVRLKY
jgi:hypothetical protein